MPTGRKTSTQTETHSSKQMIILQRIRVHHQCGFLYTLPLVLYSSMAIWAHLTKLNFVLLSYWELGKVWGFIVQDGRKSIVVSSKNLEEEHVFPLSQVPD